MKRSRISLLITMVALGIAPGAAIAASQPAPKPVDCQNASITDVAACVAVHQGKTLAGQTVGTVTPDQFQQ